MIKICAISDLHGYLPEIESVDILLIAGDISPLDIQFNKEMMKKWLNDTFANWIKELPLDKVYLVAGNHDAYFEGLSQTQLDEFRTKCNFKLVYLENNHIIHKHEDKEYKIFGTPYCHIFGNWPFMRTEHYMEEKFKQIPDEVDIIISHDPPFDTGNVDVILEAPQHMSQRMFKHLGNEPLQARIKNVNYKLLVCGHIHSGSHDFDPETKCVNVSIKNERYLPVYNPFYYELE